MGLEIYKESYTGNIKEITLGKGDNAVTIGGQACYPFYNFEGEVHSGIRLALVEAEEWEGHVGEGLAGVRRGIAKFCGFLG